MTKLPPAAVLRKAFETKDPAFDGIFWVGVRTTGIFCRPVCRAKAPKPENVRFFGSTGEAIEAGLRPCRKCHPLESRQGPPPLVARLLRLLDRDPAAPLGDDGLRKLGIDPTTARRAFLAWCGTTFQRYRRARRMGIAMETLRKGERVIDAQIETGYESASGFRTAYARIFGEAPAKGGAPPLVAERLETPLGAMVGIASDEGILLVDFLDRKGLPSAVARLRDRVGAAILPGSNPHLARLRLQLAEYFEGKRLLFDVPLVAQQGSEFQRKAWRFLSGIPCGEVRSYADEATALGSPGATRAAGSANGMNFLAIVVPCHRVVGSDGTLTGYGGGLARKQWLLEHEAAMTGKRLFGPEPATAEAKRPLRRDRMTS
jgi:AraC family transcriptional regulator of adaptative response/methylated-DNA-[protein]-cysteine methyltransferase